MMEVASGSSEIITPLLQGTAVIGRGRGARGSTRVSASIDATAWARRGVEKEIETLEEYAG